MADLRNLQPVLDAAQNQLALTFGASDSLDTKALAILGFNAAFAIFALQSELHNPIWLLALLFSALLVAGYYSTLVIMPDDYVGAIVDINKHPEYRKLAEQELILQLLVDTQQAITINGQKNEYKTTLCRRAIVSSLIGVSLLIWCIL